MRTSWIRIIGIAAAGGLLVAAGLLGPAAIAPVARAEAANDRPPTITVNGEAAVETPPDRAQVSLGVQTEAATAQAALQENNRRMQAVIDALTKAGVPREAVQTSGLSVYPVYSEAKPLSSDAPPPRVTGYRAYNRVTVQVEPARVGAVIDAGLTAGANTLDGVVFTLADPDAVAAQAIEKAFAAARTRAEAAARTAGVRLGPVRAIQVGGGGVPRAVAEMRALPAAAGAGNVPTPVEPGRISVYASVQVEFAFQP
ncbi:MAG: SIMPL domain-containing protein [Clostridia bacterium]|nr:SIMPL domain-containing protein [Clostridia bacterium]